MKLKLTFFILALLSFMGAKADVIPSSYYSTVGEGTFYLYNVTQQQFMNPEAMSTTPTRMTLQDRGNGTYSIKAENGNYEKVGHWDGNFLWCNSFDNWDAGDERAFFKWTFTSFGSGTYKLSVTPTANKTDAGYTFTAGTTYYFSTRQSITTTEAEANEWALISLANYTAYVNSVDLSTVDDATVTTNKTTMTDAKGDATASMIVNSTFDDNGDGWNGGTRTTCNTWRGTGNADYESTANVTFYKVLNNMPAGTYKVVAAVRGNNGTSAIAQIGGVNISSMTETIITNGAFDTSRQQINLNGVQMPWSSLGGFSTLGNSLGWQWITATATLTSSSNIIVAFTMLGGSWKGIDDVHLYYMNDGTTDYAMSFDDVTSYIDDRSHAITCDLQTNNPNRIYETYNDFNTISGGKLKNDLINNNWVGDLVLYDGYEFTRPARMTNAEYTTYYRRVEANSFATICVPFNKVDASGTFYQPESLSDTGVLNFEEVSNRDNRSEGKAYLFKAGASAITAFVGNRYMAVTDAPVANGTGVQMVGTFTNIDAVHTDDYVLSGTNLYKVNSTVSMKPFRAYFTIPAFEAKRISISFDGTEASEVKEILGNIPECNMYYNLAGQPVSTPTKGIYIMNGKKVLIK